MEAGIDQPGMKRRKAILTGLRSAHPGNSLSLAGADVVARGQNLVRHTVLHVDQRDVFIGDAEVQQVVIVRVLISPHDTGGLDPAGVRVDFEFNAEIAIAANAT